MAGYIFLGRQRHPLKILLFQLLTLGIYGRVYLYKILREFDGHEALFLDRRPYIPLLILPFVGPLLVKRKVTSILTDLAHHDVATPRFKPGRLSLLAWIPLVPLFHMELQRVLNHHWSMHRKELELELKRAQLAALQRSRSEEAAKAAQLLAKETAQREKELDDVRKAAIALREAEQVRLEAERAAGRRRSPMALVRKLSAAAAARLPRRGGAQALEDEQPGSSDETGEPELVGKGKKQKPEPEPEPESAPEVEPEPEDPEPVPEEPDALEPEKREDREEPTPEPAPGKGFGRFIPFFGKKPDTTSEKAAKSTKEPSEKKSGGRSFLPFFGKKSADKASENDSKKGKGAKGKKAADAKDEPSRAERKALKQKEKDKAKAAKVAAKEKKKADKAAAKEAKRAEKEAAKEAKAKAKAEKKAAKEEAKAEAKAAKEKAKAAEKKKGKAGDKKERGATKSGAKSKGAKPKARSK